jgi:hypothetical protein
MTEESSAIKNWAVHRVSSTVEPALRNVASLGVADIGAI